MSMVEITHADEAEGLREVATVMRAVGARLQGSPVGVGLLRYATKLCLRALELDDLCGPATHVVRHAPARRHLACVTPIATPEGSPS